MPNTKTQMEIELEHAAATLASVQERLEALQKQEGELRDKLKSVRGTRELPPIGLTPEPVELHAKIQSALLRESLSTPQLARAVNESTTKAMAAVTDLKRRGKIANIGSEDYPTWSWKIGDDTTTAQLRDLVRRLIQERPMTTRELALATGARFSRVGGVIVEFQRGGDKLVDMGTGHTRRWFMLSERVRDAKLVPRTPPRPEE